jgi:hypothetical protein
MYKTIQYHLKGISPIMFHNGLMADPLSPGSKAIKEVSSKRVKTDADHEQMAKIEYLYSWYLDEEKRPVIPADAFTAMLIGAAKKSKEGQKAKAGAFVMGHAQLEFVGEKDPEKLWEQRKFIDRRLVRVMNARVVRTRPLIDKWGATIEITFDDSLLNKADVDRWMETAGHVIGLCEMRPIFGRFELV